MFIETITPRFCDTDALGHISNTTIPKWFEGARNPVFKLFTPELNWAKWPLILARIEIDFVQQVLYEKDVEVRTFISRLGNASFDVAQELWQEGELKAKGKAVMVNFCYDKQSSLPIEGELRATLHSHLIIQDN